LLLVEVNKVDKAIWHLAFIVRPAGLWLVLAIKPASRFAFL